MGFLIEKGRLCRILLRDTEPEAVRIAAENLREDLVKVFDEDIMVECITSLADQLAKNSTLSAGSVDEGDISAAKTNTLLVRIETSAWPGCRKEEYRLSVREGVLYITGADRRGTIYGIYEFSEMLGVSPWYFWADVPVKTKDSFSLPEGYEKSDAPSVEYRGIFINDEEELDRWVQAHMGEDTIGVRTYEKIFELLLRLKANYIWPAMHVNSFNVKQENGALAERMGIVVGTSHCDMLMRSNNREWKPWIAKKGYEGAEYDYSIPGRNREILKEYWRESVEQNKDFEVCYTLGMRGIHDSGFETRALKGLSGQELKEAKISLLKQVMDDQQEILRETLGRETMMTFVPYKEVLELYDGGLEIPEDITLVWANDNYGYIRRYPSEKEKRRKGGNGIYYHNSYWAPPGMSYVFLCSIPLAHTAYELRKAYGEGIRKLWVMNVGAMKPLEQEMEFFLRLAWEVGKENALTEDVDTYVADWIDRNFSGGIGGEASVLLNEFSQLTNVRKLEMMDQDAFSQTAYGDEAVSRIHRYEELFERGNALYRGLPAKERDAFFQLVLMRIHAAYFTNLAWYYGDRSTYANEMGRFKTAEKYVSLTRQLEDARRRMLLYYNKRMADGKWEKILDPEGFPPPRAAMLPVCTPPVAASGPRLKATLWNEGEKLSFAKPGEKWFELDCGGAEGVEFEAEAPDFVTLSRYTGMIETEVRILVGVEKISANRQGVIRVYWKGTSQVAEIPVETVYLPEPCENVEEDGMVAVEAENFVAVEAESALSSAFRRIARLGRDRGSLMEACLGKGSGSCECNVPDGGSRPESAERRENQLRKECVEQQRNQLHMLCTEPQGNKTQLLCYEVTFVSEGEFLLEVHRFPSLNSTGQIRIGVSMDDGPVQTLESASNDEHRGTWRENVRNNVDRLYLKLPYLKAGKHRICFHPIDKYFAFSRFVIYTNERKDNNLAGFAGGQALPAAFDPENFAREFYGEITLGPRPVEYARRELEHDTLVAAGLICQAQEYASPISAEYYYQKGKQGFEEQDGKILIDAASVLAESESAYTAGSEAGIWRHCSSESFGRSGLAMYVRHRGKIWEDIQSAPSLNFRLKCAGGDYTLWLLSCFGMREESFFGVEVDGDVLPAAELYGKGCLWRYEAEQIYRWVPVAELTLSAGEHLLSLHAKAAGLRIDRLCLLKGGELPPMDIEWGEKVIS